MCDCGHDDEFISDMADDAERLGKVEDENAKLRSAIAICLRAINDFFGLTDDEIAVAINEAISTPDKFSPYRES